MSIFTAAIVGGTGFTGGELARLLMSHPSIRLDAITSRSSAGEPIHRAHPNLRGCSDLIFTPPAELGEYDVLFLCMPHGVAANEIDQHRARARIVVDLSADFRLSDPAAHERWYGASHPAPAALGAAVYGLPELTRERLRSATLISGVGCNATAMNIALKPLAEAGLIERALCDIKVGSSEAGAESNAGSHHPIRARATRTYSPAGHRHLGEVEQALGPIPIDATVTAIDMVRGVLCAAHVTPTKPLAMKDLWKLYRAAYADEPFVRIVCERTGLHRLPDPRVLVGSNFADIGFAIDERSGRVIVLSAIDNLMKGAAGTALQAMNLALGLDERAGLTFPGLHPA
jgi:N-acetyl-gamma-glutamyl-phosphate/LysW-gamma-L-alpha-aminoadipyl-6-phosphate reductase